MNATRMFVTMKKWLYIVLSMCLLMAGAETFAVEKSGVSVGDAAKTSASLAAAKGVGNAYKIAQAGGKHAGFLKNYASRSPAEISKAIKSMQSGKQGINVHLDKIANPTKYVPNWNTLRSGHQQSLINGWQNTVTKHTEQIQILRTLLGN